MSSDFRRVLCNLTRCNHPLLLNNSHLLYIKWFSIHRSFLRPFELFFFLLIQSSISNSYSFVVYNNIHSSQQTVSTVLRTVAFKPILEELRYLFCSHKKVIYLSNSNVFAMSFRFASILFSFPFFTLCFAYNMTRKLQ